MTSSAIPYAEIDIEIRALVELLNRLPGIETTDSCAGHSETDEAYIAFFAASQESLTGLLSLMPFWDWRAGFVANRPYWQSLWVSVTMQSGRPWYNLKIGGSPKYAQRRALGEVEAALMRALNSGPR